MSRIIGVTEPSNFTVDCIDCIEQFFGANPLKLCQNKTEDIYHWVDMCDAVILAGGVDIHPMIYGESILNDAGLSRFDFKRDKRELRIIHRCREKQIPVLGICRGHQMLGIYHRMNFVIDLATSNVCHQPLRQQISHGKDEPMHEITIIDDKLKQMLTPKEDTHFTNPYQRVYVNSFHHQGVEFTKKPVKDVRVLATAPGLSKGQIVEWMVSDDPRWNWMSVQWHPEYDWRENEVSATVLKIFHDMISAKQD